MFSAAVHSRRAQAAALTVAIVAIVAVPATALSSGTTYKGKSSQHEPVSLRAQAGQIEVFRIAWIAHCKVTHAVLGSPAHPLRTKQTHITLTAHGTWSVSGTYTASSGNGYTEKFRVSDHGTMTKKGTVRGSFKGTAKIYRASKNGAYVDTCTSGKVTFTLK